MGFPGLYTTDTGAFVLNVFNNTTIKQHRNPLIFKRNACS